MILDRPDPEPPRRILVVEDSEACRRLLRAHLRFENVEWIEAPSGPDGLAACRVHRPDLILLDVSLPGFSGYELIRLLKDDPQTRSVPVIFLSATTSTEDKARGLDLGAVDFLTKPFDPIELRARVRAALRTKDLQDLLEQRAHIDGLTGLGNRLALEERLAAEWTTCRRRGCPLGVLIADLDHFKRINDRHGHSAGDLVLRAAAKALRVSVRGGDFVARYGGEEFVAVAPDCDLAGASAIAERYRAEVAALSVPFHGSAIAVTTSVGVVSTSDPSITEPADLLIRADRALYQAKASGRDAVRIWGWDPAGAPPALEPPGTGSIRPPGAGAVTRPGAWIFTPGP